jgi:1-deoxyxylulose-5-phosphate synthase
MEHVRFGATGLQVSRLCLGTMTFGRQCDEPTSVAILDEAERLGFTLLDTADVYPLGGGIELAGKTEEILGRWLKPKRQRFVLATKFAGVMGDRPWQRGASRKHIFDAIDGSLRRLQTDYVDLYQVHQLDTQTSVDETLQALDDVIRSGRVRYIGVSNWPAYRVARALGRAEVLSVATPASVQPRYNLIFREFERELFPLCREEGLAVLPYNPLAGGLLTGKHSKQSGPTSGTRFSGADSGRLYVDRYWRDRELTTVDDLRTIAEEEGISMAQMAVAWVLANPVITSAIVGASKPEQLKDSAEALAKPLSAALKQRLDSLTESYRYGDALR